MAFSSGKNKADINVTPMIDVLLVLLIIFMVVVERDSVGLKAKVPQEPEKDSEPPPFPSNDVVITVHADGVVDFNQEPVAPPEVEARFRNLFRLRGDHVIFVRAAGDLEFAPVAHVIDLAYGAGIRQVALMDSEMR